MTHQLASNTQVLSAGHGALRCFSTAFRTCLVRQLLQAYSANFGGWKGPITVTTCHRITADRRGVVLGCAVRRVLIPATTTGPGR